MARPAQPTHRPVLDQRNARAIANGAPALIGDLREVDRNQWALFLRYGNPAFWISCISAGAEEITIEIPSPPGVQFMNVSILAAGDGGLIDNGSGIKIGKADATILITHDKDGNGTNLLINSEPNNLSASFTGLDDVVYTATNPTTADATTANETGRKLRVEDNDNNATKIHRTVRINVPSGVTLYGVGFEPIFRDV